MRRRRIRHPLGRRRGRGRACLRCQRPERACGALGHLRRLHPRRRPQAARAVSSRLPAHARGRWPGRDGPGALCPLAEHRVPGPDALADGLAHLVTRPVAVGAGYGPGGVHALRGHAAELFQHPHRGCVHHRGSRSRAPRSSIRFTTSRPRGESALSSGRKGPRYHAASGVPHPPPW